MTWIARSAIAAGWLIAVAVDTTPASAGPPDSNPAIVPPVLHGTWRTECRSHRHGSLTFRPEAVILGPAEPKACRLVGLRVQSGKRWYLDFSCPDTSIAHLDIVQSSPRELMISERPLGEACDYTKDEQGP